MLSAKLQPFRVGFMLSKQHIPHHNVVKLLHIVLQLPTGYFPECSNSKARLHESDNNLFPELVMSKIDIHCRILQTLVLSFNNSQDYVYGI